MKAFKVLLVILLATVSVSAVSAQIRDKRIVVLRHHRHVMKRHIIKQHKM